MAQFFEDLLVGLGFVAEFYVVVEEHVTGGGVVLRYLAEDMFCRAQVVQQFIAGFILADELILKMLHLCLHTMIGVLMQDLTQADIQRFDLVLYKKAIIDPLQHFRMQLSDVFALFCDCLFIIHGFML